MKPQIALPLILVGILALLWSCFPRPSSGPSAVEPALTESRLLRLAQSAFDSGKFQDAEDIALDVLARYPEGPEAAQALLWLGRSRRALENTDGAEAAFARLIAQYPGHPAAEDGKVELFQMYFQLERYQDIIRQAPVMIDGVSDTERLFRLYLVLGDAQTAAGAGADAFDAYLWARERAPAGEVETVKERMRAVSTLLKGDELDLLLNQPLDEWTRGLLMFQLGIVRAGEGHYDEAVWHFNRFVEDFPYHDNVNVAYQLIEQLNDTIAFDQYAVGCLLPLSGPYRVFGRRALEGIELAFQEIHEIEPDLPIRLIVRDTGSDPDQAARAMEGFLEMKVAAVIGPIATAESAAGIAQDAGIPILTLTQKEDITSSGRYVFRNFITPRMQASAIADYAVHRAGMKRFAILYPEEAYGRTFMGVFWDELERRGGTVVGLESYAPDQTDFGEPIKKLVGLHHPIPEELKPRDLPLTLMGEKGMRFLKTRAAAEEDDEMSTGERSRSLQKIRTSGLGVAGDADLPIVDFEGLFIPDSPGKAGLIVPQLAFNDIRGVTLFGTNLWQSERFLDMAGNFLKGAVFPTGFYAESRKTNVKRFVQRFEAVYGRKPEFIEAVAYDSAKLMLATVLSPDAWLRNGIRYRLVSMDGFDGVTGFTRFRLDGEPEKAPFLLQVRKNDFVEMDFAASIYRPAAGNKIPPPPKRVWKGQEASR